MKKRNYGFCIKKISCKPLLFSTLRNLIFPFLLRLRLYFASKFETSKISNLIEKAYASFLNLPLRSVGIFLFSFSFLSVLIDLYSFPAANNVYELLPSSLIKLFLITISVLLFTSKAPTGQALSCGFAFPILNFDENLPNNSKNKSPMYSQALFVGLILGSLSSLIDFNRLFIIVLICIFSLICYNYPESGVLITASLIPFFSGITTIFTTLITLISFVFKYLRGKRHGSFDAPVCTLFFFAIYVSLSLFASTANLENLAFISAILFPILATALINSSRLAKKLLTIVYTSSVIKLALNSLYILFSIYDARTHSFAKLLVLENSFLENLLTDTKALHFYIILTFPLAFSVFISSKQLYVKIKFLLPILFMTIPVMIFPDVNTILAILLSIVLIISAYKKYLIACIVFVPTLSKFITNILNTFSDALFKTTATPRFITPESLSNFKKVSNLLFGKGLNFKSLQMYDKLIGALISTIGILGLTIFFIAVIIITKQCLKFIYSSKICPDNNKEISIGVFAMLITFTVFAFTSNTVSDITNISQFFVYISLALTCIKCSRNDYIDQFAIRDYPEISGCT